MKRDVSLYNFISSRIRERSTISFLYVAGTATILSYDQGRKGISQKIYRVGDMDVLYRNTLTIRSTKDLVHRRSQEWLDIVVDECMMEVGITHER